MMSEQNTGIKEMVGLNPNGKLKVLKHLILMVFQHFSVLPAAGLEPARGCPQQILSLPRLPFRHAGISTAKKQ